MAKKASDNALACIENSMVRKIREVTGKAIPKSCVQFWILHFCRDTEVVEQVLRWAMKLVKARE